MRSRLAALLRIRSAVIRVLIRTRKRVTLVHAALVERRSREKLLASHVHTPLRLARSVGQISAAKSAKTARSPTLVRSSSSQLDLKR